MAIFKNIWTHFKSSPLSGEKPKIMCTLGTSTDNPEVLKEMHSHGFEMARINTKHAAISDYERRVGLLRDVIDIPVMLDLNGPQIRLLTDKRYAIPQGEKFLVGYENGGIRFNQNIIPELEKGEFVLLGNGSVRTTVVRKGNGLVELQVLEPGENERIVPNMGVNVPGKRFRNLKVLTEKDDKVIDFGVGNMIGHFALSFVRNFQEVQILNQAIEAAKERRKVEFEHTITIKVEDVEGIENLEGILDGCHQSSIKTMVMIARGDIFIELPPSKMPFIQKQIIGLCKKKRVPSIVATGLLLSMQENPVPTRAEVSDVANAIVDGADWLMLSDETSNSHYPVEAVMMLEEVMEAWVSHHR
ncbi:MAG: pyruvate kinase [archaeon]